MVDIGQRLAPGSMMQDYLFVVLSIVLDPLLLVAKGGLARKDGGPKK